MGLILAMSPPWTQMPTLDIFIMCQKNLALTILWAHRRQVPQPSFRSKIDLGMSKQVIKINLKFIGYGNSYDHIDHLTKNQFTVERGCDQLVILHFEYEQEVKIQVCSSNH